MSFEVILYMNIFIILICYSGLGIFKILHVFFFLGSLLTGEMAGSQLFHIAAFFIECV